MKTKIEKDIEEILKKELPEIIRELKKYYPIEQEYFRGFYENLRDGLLSCSIYFVIEPNKTEKDYLDCVKPFLPEGVKDEVRGPIRNIANELHKYKTSVSPEDIKELKSAIKYNQSYIA